MQQRSHIDWIKMADHNTSFFGRTTKQWEVWNSIMRTLNHEGIQVTNLMEMKARVVEHFDQVIHLCSKNTFRNRYCLFRSNHYRDKYQAPAFPNDDQVKHILFSMPKGKATGPDGILAISYVIIA